MVLFNGAEIALEDLAFLTGVKVAILRKYILLGASAETAVLLGRQMGRNYV